MLANDHFAENIAALRRRVATLNSDSLDLPPGQSPVPTETIEELQTALEELRVAEEELRQQNDELQGARQTLEAERQRYQDLFEFAPDAYLVTNTTAKIQEANRAAAILLRVPQPFLVGKPLMLYLAREEHAAFIARLRQLSEQGERQEWEMRLRPRKGQPLDALLAVAAVRDRQGNAVALRWLLRDVTGRKQEERLAAIGQMVAGLAHESRNALQRTQACLERLSWKLQDQADALDLVARANKAQDNLTHLFNDIRDYAAPIQLEPQMCDLAAIWREAWAKLGPLRQGRDAELHEQTGACDLHCPADAFRLEQVFYNILDNALAACGESARIDISCGETTLRGRPALRVAVHDNGPGLSADQRARIFEPFYTTKTRGTGLGLAIARRLVETHGGQLAVSDRPGSGAEILITLPRRRP